MLRGALGLKRRRWGYILAAAAVVTAAIPLVRRQAPVQRESLPVQSDLKSAVRARPTAIEVGRSVQGRPIAASRWNEDDGPPILVFSGIHGDERSAIELAMRLEKRWRADPSLLRGRHVVFIPILNPDGFEANTRKNAHGVDLNRNFPDGWLASAPRTADHGGTSPLSEPEAILLHRLVNDESPARILSIHSCRTCGGMNNYDGPARELAESMSAENNYRASSEWWAKTPGSFGTHAGQVRGIPIITLEIPRDISDEAEWERNVRAVDAFVRFAAAADNTKRRSSGPLGGWVTAVRRTPACALSPARTPRTV